MFFLLYIKTHVLIYDMGKLKISLWPCISLLLPPYDVGSPCTVAHFKLPDVNDKMQSAENVKKLQKKKLQKPEEKPAEGAVCPENYLRALSAIIKSCSSDQW